MNGKLKDVFVIAVLGLTLTFAAWRIFYAGEKDTSTVGSTGTQTEQKISRLLEEIEGVGDASVMICETEEGVQSAVVVCEGANNLQVVMNVREAVAAALGTQQNAVKIYLKKE